MVDSVNRMIEAEFVIGYTRDDELDDYLPQAWAGLDVLPPVSKAQAELIWNRASQRYAENVSGEITLFVHKSEGTRTFTNMNFPFYKKTKIFTDGLTRSNNESA
jgi:hypothetical protein